MSVDHAEFTIERRYACSPAETFAAFADRDLKRRWFAGRWENVEWELDFRVGGHELNRGGPLGGRLNEFRARYHDIVAADRIIYAYDLLHDGRLISVSLATVEFEAERGGTLMRFTEQGAFLNGDPAAPAEREHGTRLMLDRMAAVVERTD